MALHFKSTYLFCLYLCMWGTGQGWMTFWKGRSFLPPSGLWQHNPGPPTWQQASLRDAEPSWGLTVAHPHSKGGVFLKCRPSEAWKSVCHPALFSQRLYHTMTSPVYLYYLKFQHCPEETSEDPSTPQCCLCWDEWQSGGNVSYEDLWMGAKAKGSDASVH